MLNKPTAIILKFTINNSIISPPGWQGWQHENTRCHPQSSIEVFFIFTSCVLPQPL